MKVTAVVLYENTEMEFSQHRGQTKTLVRDGNVPEVRYAAS